MNVKDKVLVGIIADMENAARNQDDYIENLDDRLAQAEDTIRGLTAEKIQAAEVFHASCVEKDERISAITKENKDISERLNVVIGQRERYIKRSNSFEAKASKLNAEKLKLLELIKLPFNGGEAGIMTSYNKWLKTRGKK